MHGLGSELEVWEPVVDRLAASFDVICVDMPGFGQSPPLTEAPAPPALANAVAVLLDELAIETAHVAGNSLGGWVGLELALIGRAQSVTALCPAGMWRVPPAENNPEPTDRSQRIARRVRPFIPLAMRVPRIRRLALSTFVFHPDRVPLPAATRMAMAYADATAYSATSAAMRANRFTGIDELSVPTVIAWAEHDRLLRSHELSTPHVRTVHLPDCGHTPMFDQPHLVTELISANAH